MKRFLLWSFERGSAQYDVICVVILAFIFLTPASLFNDRPDFMRVPTEAVHETSDDDGHRVFTVKVESLGFSPEQGAQQAAVDRLKATLGSAFTVSRMEPVYDTTGMLAAYSIWIER